MNAIYVECLHKIQNNSGTRDIANSRRQIKHFQIDCKESLAFVWSLFDWKVLCNRKHSICCVHRYEWISAPNHQMAYKSRSNMMAWWSLEIAIICPDAGQTEIQLRSLQNYAKAAIVSTSTRLEQLQPPDNWFLSNVSAFWVNRFVLRDNKTANAASQFALSYGIAKLY